MNKIFKKCSAVLMCCILTVSVLTFKASALGQTDYVIDSYGKTPLPMCYVADKKIERVYAGSYLDKPKNMFIDSSDNLYVADSANNRIVKFNSEMEFVKEFTVSNSLNNPSGVHYDDENKELYIADTDNERIAVVDENDKFIREYRKPKSELLDEDMTFNLTNISLGIQGYIYLIKGQNFMQLNQDGEFKGYVGSTKVPANLITTLIRRFASEKQKKLLVTEQPNPYTNFTTDKNGVIYAVLGTDSSQIRKINMAGDNLYPEKFYGEMVYKDGWQLVNPNFISIAVSDDGIISVLEEISKRVYQYSQDGVMLNVFGGEGEVEGFFQSPSAIAVDSKGSVYVADVITNTVQRFKRTTFASSVYDAQVAYDKGMYEEAYELYLKAKAVNPNYSVLNNGLAECLYKMGKIDEAEKIYKSANNREGFGKVQAIKRKQFMNKYFGWICLAILTAVIAVIFVIYKVRKYSGHIIRRYYHLDD